MKAQIITIGDEILIGQIVDTNSPFIASLLEKIGVKVVSIISISDKAEAIYATLSNSVKEYDVTITTGGLGPTKDDITKSVLCDIFKCELELHQPSYEFNRERLTRIGIEFNELNQSQAMLPSKAQVIKNHHGTAPALLFEESGNLLFSLPGVPYEMKPLITDSVLPIIASKFTLPAVYHKTAITFGLPESELALKISSWEDNLPSNIRLAYLPSTGRVRLRLSAISADIKDAEASVNALFEELRAIIGFYFIGYDDATLESSVAEMLTERGETLSVAESCTGGKISSLFTSMEGASLYLKGGVVAYSNEVKRSLLGVSDKSLSLYGAVSQQVACEMAEGVRRVTGSDYGVSTTGIASPVVDSDKSVGEVWIAVSSERGCVSKHFNFSEIRTINIERFSSAAIAMLRNQIIEQIKG